MTLTALADSFRHVNSLPIAVNDVLSWIKENTDYKIIELHGVERRHKAFRGAFKRTAIPVGGLYSGEIEIHVQILYGKDLPSDWRRLVIVKEALHIFDPPGSCVSTPEGLKRLIPAIILPELKHTEIFTPALNDKAGSFKAMSILLPSDARVSLAAAVDNGSRTVEEIARYVNLPEAYVDIWLRHGEELEPVFLNGAV